MRGEGLGGRGLGRGRGKVRGRSGGGRRQRRSGPNLSDEIPAIFVVYVVNHGFI